MSDTVVHEWRVTGQPSSAYGVEFPPYEYVWRDDEMYDDRGRRERALTLTAEQAARRFVEAVSPWDDGPHIHHRTVTYTQWEPSDTPNLK